MFPDGQRFKDDRKVFSDKPRPDHQKSKDDELK